MTGLRRGLVAGLAWGLAVIAMATAQADEKTIKSAGKGECKIHLDVEGEPAGTFGGLYIDGTVVYGPRDIPVDRGARDHDITLSPVISTERPLKQWQADAKLGVALDKSIDITISADCNIELDAPVGITMAGAQLVAEGTSGTAYTSGGAVSIKGSIVMIN